MGEAGSTGCFLHFGKSKVIQEWLPSQYLPSLLLGAALLLYPSLADAGPIPSPSASPISHGVDAASGMISHLNDFAPLVAYLAILPWLAQLVSWLYRGLDANVRQLEVGFSYASLGVGLDGYIVALGGSSIVSEMRVVVRRISDGAIFVLPWNLARQHVFRSTSGIAGLEGSMEGAKPFMVPNGTVFNFNVVFTAPVLADRTATIIRRVNTDWLSYIATVRPSSATSAPTPQHLTALFHRFRTLPGYTQAITDMQNELSTWTPDRYEFELSVSTYGFRRGSRKKWMFDLDASHLQTLGRNIDGILMAACGQLPQNWVWNFVFPTITRTH